MSLDYNLLKVRTDLPIGSDERQQWWDNVDWYQFQALVFNTIPVGINHIKDEATAVAFYRRVLMYYMARWQDTPMYDLAFVKQFIGMSTNATPITDPAFASICRQELMKYANAKIKAESNPPSPQPEEPVGIDS